MPGLLRGVARTAAIAGTATAVSNRVSRRQANRWAAQEEQQYQAQAYQQQAYQQQAYQQQPQYEPAPQPQQDMVQQLKDLAALKDQGVLTEEEFAAQKARILGG
jgi:Short C-terminal domain